MSRQAKKISKKAWLWLSQSEIEAAEICRTIVNIWTPSLAITLWVKITRPSTPETTTPPSSRSLSTTWPRQNGKRFLNQIFRSMNRWDQARQLLTFLVGRNNSPRSLKSNSEVAVNHRKNTNNKISILSATRTCMVRKIRKSAQVPLRILMSQIPAKEWRSGQIITGPL